MTKSRTKTFGFWILILATLFSIGIPIAPFFQESNDKIKVAALAFGSFLILFFGSQIWRDSKHILINSIDETITFTNLLTRQKTIYYFKEIEGYIDMYQSSRSGSYRVLYLVQDNKFVQKISTFIYSNVGEMEGALKPIKYLGQKDFSFLRSIKILLKLNVLND
jgi:hypothetical protein